MRMAGSLDVGNSNGPDQTAGASGRAAARRPPASPGAPLRAMRQGKIRRKEEVPQAGHGSRRGMRRRIDPPISGNGLHARRTAPKCAKTRTGRDLRRYFTVSMPAFLRAAPQRFVPLFPDRAVDRIECSLKSNRPLPHSKEP
jgi:hypothetical protein